MASKAAYKRLQKEYLAIQKQPPPFIVAKPLESNILEWHYVLTGPPDSPYENGEYWGTVVFPSEYPFKPPSLKMLTPSGRFQCDFKLCLSMSNYHEELWNPAWSVSTILTGLLSFMVGSEETTGSIKTSTPEKIALARTSRTWNRQQKKFRDIWPELADLPSPQLDTGIRQRVISKQEQTQLVQNNSPNLVQFAQRYTFLLSFLLLLALWIGVKALHFIAFDETI